MYTYSNRQPARIAATILAAVLLCLVIVGASALLATPHKASALSGSQFDAGRIIDDSIFYSPNTMSPAQIQQFLNSKVPTCDTNGSQWHHTGRTRAQHGIANGVPPPYVCLKNYSQAIPNITNSGSNLCGGNITAGTKSAAQIIYDVAQACSINPKVLLVLLQKEQSLITDDWPWPIQYRSATGYGCPDTAPCDAEFYGFFNQVYQAAKAYKRYRANQTNYNYRAGRSNTILWHPNTGCGTSNVYIVNQATAGLYIYTPYRPNQAALNNLYGTGDSCSSYGNRNFWRLFNDWFGPTVGGDPVSDTLRIVSPINTSPANPIAGEPVTISYTVQNYSGQSQTLQNDIVQCRVQAVNCDSNLGSSLTIPAGAQHTFTKTLTSNRDGNHLLVPFFSQGGVWYRYGVQESPYDNTRTVYMPNLKIIGSINSSPAAPIAGQPAHISFTVQNFGSQTIYLQTSVLQCRLNENTNCDSAHGGALPLSPGDKRTFGYNLSSLSEGNHTLVPYFMVNGVWYKYSAGPGGSTSKDIYTPDVRLINPIDVSPALPIPGQEVTVSYTVRNHGTQTVSYSTSVLQCRINSVINCDPGYRAGDTLTPDQQRTFTETFILPRHGAYTLTPYYNMEGTWFRYGGKSTQIILNAPMYIADMRLTGNITATPASPIPGQNVEITYTVKNHGDKPAIYQRSILQCRRNSVVNCDPPTDAPMIIQPGSQNTFTVNIPSVKAGQYIFTPYFSQNNAWYKYSSGDASSNQLVINIPPYNADLRLASNIAASDPQPDRGDTVTITYTVKNHGDKPAIYQHAITQCRLNTTVGCDPAWKPGGTINPGDERIFTETITLSDSGTYKFTPYFYQNDSWKIYNRGSANNTQLTITVP